MCCSHNSIIWLRIELLKIKQITAYRFAWGWVNNDKLFHQSVWSENRGQVWICYHENEQMKGSLLLISIFSLLFHLTHLCATHINNKNSCRFRAFAQTSHSAHTYGVSFKNMIHKCMSKFIFTANSNSQSHNPIYIHKMRFASAQSKLTK